VLRLVTRLCHERGGVRTSSPRPQRPVAKAGPNRDWVLLPGNSRRLWRHVLERQPELRAWSDASPHTVAAPGTGRLGVVTAGPRAATTARSRASSTPRRRT
jgi:TPP-dependent indolepyruvate ferredoxin oxidoreductase alpha subunit